jgi:hypothetical protein
VNVVILDRIRVTAVAAVNRATRIGVIDARNTYRRTMVGRRGIEPILPNTVLIARLRTRPFQQKVFPVRPVREVKGEHTIPI